GLTSTLQKHLEAAKAHSIQSEKTAFESRINEVAALRRNQSIERLRIEIEQRRDAARQYSLLEDVNERAEREIRELEDELERRKTHFGHLLERLKNEKQRILERVIPNRFSLRGDAQTFP